MNSYTCLVGQFCGSVRCSLKGLNEILTTLFLQITSYVCVCVCREYTISLDALYATEKMLYYNITEFSFVAYARVVMGIFIYIVNIAKSMEHTSFRTP